jgi:multiple sugar transport system ATP-binding protein
MASVTLKGATKIFPPDVVAVNKVDLEISDKEFLVLVGPSGCGKSTTLRMIAGLEEVTEGDIHIDDVRVNDVPPKNRDIAMVFQNYALYPHMTVYKNMAFGLKLRKYPKAEIEQRVKDAADILGIQDLLHRKPKALSGGQRQRVAVGRAIVRKPKVFLFDEPLSNLDAKLRVQMRTEISKLHNQLQSTMIYVTHDQVEAMTMGDRIVVLKDGDLEQIDSPMNLYDKPLTKFVAGFIGSPPMNFFSGRVTRDNGSFMFDGGKFKVNVPKRFNEILGQYDGKEITLGMRPENISEQKKNQDDAEVTSTVDLVEPMGAEYFVYLNTGDNAYIARTTEFSKSALGASIDVFFNMDQAHFFDAETEKSIIFTN